MTDITKFGENLTSVFKTIGTSISGIDAGSIEKFSALSKAAGYIKNFLNAMTKIEDPDALSGKIDKLFKGIANAINNNIDEATLNKANTLANSLDTIRGSARAVGGGRAQLAGGLRLGAALVMAKKTAVEVAKIAKYGADYAETLNLWTVSMGQFNQQATTFINKMSAAYGISEKTLMNAQAVFKNMLGSLGQISDQAAYTISESVTKMAIDFASLYNVEIDAAMTKFQAALAGQVRPIRTRSGLDITETTTYQLYQSLGGQKTMRQLTITEKRLLAIYAIFKQMGASGALNDMERTINSFANQTRILNEQMTRVKSFSGVILTDWLQTFGVLKNVNAILIFIAEIMKVLANSTQAMKDAASYGADAIMQGVEESAYDAGKAIDEVKGKLLGFDKFRSLSGGEEDAEDLSVDEVLLAALKDYSSIYDGIDSQAEKIAASWLKIFGIEKDAETGAYNVNKKFEGLKNTLGLIAPMLIGIVTTFLGAIAKFSFAKLAVKFKGLGETIQGAFSLKKIGIMALIAAIVYLYRTNEDFRKSVQHLFEVLMKALQSVITPLSKVLGTVSNLLVKILNALAPILTFIVDVVASLIEVLDKLHILEGVVWVLISYFVFYKGLQIGLTIYELIYGLGGLSNAVKLLGTNISKFLTSPKGALTLAVIGFALLADGIFSIINGWDDMSGLERAAAVLKIVAGAAFLAAAAIASMHTAWSLGVAAATIAIGIGAVIASIAMAKSKAASELTTFAEGGLPDKGTLFVAGEAGAEMVYNNPNGQSGVANVKQIEQAMYNALVAYGNTHKGGDNEITVYLDGEVVYRNTTSKAKAHGNVWAKA